MKKVMMMAVLAFMTMTVQAQMSVDLSLIHISEPTRPY